MVRLGIVYEIHNNKAVVMTPDSEFIVIKRTRDMYVGQQVKFNIQDIRKTMKPVHKYASIVSSVAAAFILVSMFFRIAFNDKAYGFVSVDINPSIEFSFDKDFDVLETKALNSDGEVIVNKLDAEGKDVYNVIKDILEESETHGYIKQDKSNVVLVSVSLNDKSKEYSRNRITEGRELEGFLLDLDKRLNSENSDYIKGRVIKVTPEERKAAEEKDLSMGEYYLLEKAKESGVVLASEELQNQEIAYLLSTIYANNITIATHGPSPDGQQGKAEDESTPKVTTGTENEVIATPTAKATEKPTAKPTEKPATQTATAKKQDTANSAPSASKSDKPKTTTENGGQSTESSGLKLQISSIDNDDGNKIISSRIKVINTGKNDIDLSKVKVRYYFTKENKSHKDGRNVNLVPSVYNYSMGRVNDPGYCVQQTTKDVVISFHEVSGTNMYMEIGFQTGILKKGEYAYVMSAFNKDDWSSFEETNDYSYTVIGDKFQDSKYITAYISDTLVWGVTPY